MVPASSDLPDGWGSLSSEKMSQQNKIHLVTCDESHERGRQGACGPTEKGPRVKGFLKDMRCEDTQMNEDVEFTH